MDTIKTFMRNSTKDTADEREPYTSDQATTSGSDDVPTPSSDERSSNTTSTKTTGATKSTSTGTQDFDSDITVLPPVTQEHHHKKIIDENETIIDRDHDVDHYKKKIQPIAVAENTDTVDSAGTVAQEERTADNSNPEALKKGLAAQDAPQNTIDEEVTHESRQKEDKVRDNVHHHVHEAVQPVIEKDVYKTEVRHNKKLVHEQVQEEAVVEPTEVLPTKQE